MHRADVVIIGAGATGAALARELAKFKLSVLVVDRLNDVGGEASKSNSAIVHTGFDAPPGSLESDLVVHSNPMFDRLCADLDIPLQQGMAGGGSDGNYTSLYTATLDGLGAVGDGAHARHEFLYIDKMIERTALLALLLLAP